MSSRSASAGPCDPAGYCGSAPGICDPILRTWATMPNPLPQYTAGSQGPKEAEKILLGDAHWRMI